MRPTRTYRTGITALAGGLILLSGVTPAPAAKGGAGTLQIASVKLVGDAVEVTLVNTGSETLRATLVFEVVVDGERTLAMVPVTAWGGQKVFVKWGASGAVDQIGGLGIIVDDGAPI
jgi:hypothetical protein